MSTLVSIIVPVYNVQKYIRRCLDSIINQTYKTLEIILIDDGSTDDSGKICDEYAKKDNRIIVKHNTNRGVSYARNYGIKLANGQYLSFIDPDDYVDLDYIENLLRPMLEDDYDLVVCNIKHVYTNKIINNALQVNMLTNNYYNDFYLLDILRATPVNKLFRSNIIKLFDLKFFENLSYSEDRIFNYNYGNHVKKYKYVNKAMYYYCHRDEISLSKLKTLKSFESAIIALEQEKIFLYKNNVKNKKIILTDSAISYLGDFAKLEDEKKLQYMAFYRRAQKIRSILNGSCFHKVLKRKLVAICLEYNIIVPLYFYYCIIKEELKEIIIIK